MPLEVCSVVGRGREVGCDTGCERERRDRGMREEVSGAPAVCLCVCLHLLVIWWGGGGRVDYCPLPRT